MKQRIEYRVETLGDTLRVVENIDETGFGDDIALCGDCISEQNQEKAKNLCNLLNDRLSAYDEITRLREQNAELLAALTKLAEDTSATYEAAKKGKLLEISIGKFGRLAAARNLIANAEDMQSKYLS